MGIEIGVDIGGTGVRAASVHDGVLGEVRRVSLDSREVDAVVEAVAEAVGPLQDVLGVGVGVPGFVDAGVVRGSPNFPGWVDVPLRERLSEQLGVPVWVDNDANCAALGAWLERGAREHLVVLTLGTGVGGGVISHGQLLRGARGTGAELGHVWVGGDQPCGCGGVGCVETWLGTVGLRARVAEAGHPQPDGESIVAAARAGEPWACTALDDAARALGRALVVYSNLFNPDAILLVGGLTEARDLLETGALEWLRRHGVPPSVAHVHVAWGGRADHLAIRGAAGLIKGQ